ncbi:MAG: ThiF family adenylyltransferase [Actinomycetota bacterium]|nr:ThiF family adenylyltransferase [Actinomycetota bacterium]
MGAAKSGQDLLKEARASVASLDPETAARLAEGGEATLVDVREGDEWRKGHAPGAVWASRSWLEMQAESKLPDKEAPLILYCAGGNRSALATRTLQEMGYSNVRHIRGGFSAWRDAGLKVVTPRQWTERQLDRYSRHFVLPEVGEAGQQRIADGSVLVIGAGGLGSPALYYLAAAGVGRLGIVDFDSVEENNLQRQIIHSTSRIGMNKAESAAKTIQDLNPDVKVDVWRERLTPDNIGEIMEGFDIVIDATDNFDTRYLVNEAAVEQGIPSIYGSIYRFEGYASVFWPKKGGPCYRCMHPEPPPAELAPT